MNNINTKITEQEFDADFKDLVKIGAIGIEEFEQDKALYLDNPNNFPYPYSLKALQKLLIHYSTNPTIPLLS